MAIIVKYGKVTDALGKVKEGYFILDDGQVCGGPEIDKEKAERIAEAIRQMRHASK